MEARRGKEDKGGILLILVGLVTGVEPEPGVVCGMEGMVMAVTELGMRGE